MPCMICGNKNPGNVLYCQKCGAKLDMTADEVQAYYERKIRLEKRRAAEFHALRFLGFAIALFLISVTVYMMSSAMPENPVSIPSATVGTDFIKYEFDFDPPVRALLIPEEENRK